MLSKLTKYLKDNIDENVKIMKWQGIERLSLFLKNKYNFYEMVILNEKCLLMEMDNDIPRIDVLKKHINQVKNISNKYIVLYYKDISRYRRKSLIQDRLPFIIENGQMFLPFLGMHLTEAPEKVEYKIKKFTPSTQAGYLFFLYNKNITINTTDFSKTLNITKMTASRVLNDLYDMKLLNYKIGGKTGRSKDYQRIDDPEYFKKGKSYLKSPVNKVVYVKNTPKNSLVSGIEALSNNTMINPPRNKIRAISKKQFNKLNLEIIDNEDIIKDQQLVELQIWEYDPGMFSSNNEVDLMSLYAYFKNNNDERIQKALEQLLGGEKWFTA